MYLNKVYRSDEYCEIPKCDDFKWGCSNIPCESKYSPEPNHQLINCNSDEKLSCGCPAFEFYSHLPTCKLFNSNEDQPYYPGCLS